MLVRGIACGALVAICAGAPAAAADWPIYGHDLGNSRSAGIDGPSPTEAATLQRAWTFNSPNGDFTGTPVVADGVLVAGTNLGFVYGLDPTTGAVRWSRGVGQPINASVAIDVNAQGGPIALVPVAQVGSPRLVALSLTTGAVRWDTVLTNQSGSDVFGSPVFWRGSVYIGTSGPGNDESTARGSLVALDEATGRIRWRTYTVPPGDDGGAVWSTPAIDPATGRLYVGTGNAYHAPAAATTDSMLVLSAVTGQVLGHFQSTPSDVWELSAPANGPDYDFGASPNLFTDSRGHRLVGEGQKSGIYWALDRSTMQPAWHTSVGPGSQADGGINATAFEGSTIYGSDAIDSQVFGLDRDGAVRWNSFDSGTLHASPVTFGNGLLYSADSAGFLTVRTASTGAIVNKLPLGAPTFGGISVVGHAVFVSIGTGPPSPILPLPSSSTQQGDGNGSIIAFGDPSAPGSAGQFSLRFSSRTPNTATGAHLQAVVHRGSPNEKPSPLRSEALDLPAGARFDGGAVPACQASDSEIKALGPAACPKASQVGSGTLQAAIGSPLDPETADVTIFNWGKGTIEVVTVPGTNVTLAIDRGNFTGPGELTNHPPRGPGGPPDFETSVSAVDFTYRDVGNGRGRAFITTPPTCPSTHAWISRVSYSTADGRSYHATSATPCGAPARTRRGATRLHLTATPRRIRAGAGARLRIRVTSARASCVAGVTIRLGRLHARTNHGGRASLTLSALRPGSYRVIATKRGCGRASTTVVVLRPRRAPPPADGV
jgi:polyvinyl alcohol dehydrogenase (cytochrome)